MEDNQEDLEAGAFQQRHGTWLKNKRNVMALLAFGVGIGLAGGYGINWWITVINTVSTDDARVIASYATISSEVAGKIIKFPADDGDSVRKGDLLVEIDQEEYKNALDEAVADLNRVTAQYEEGQLQFKGMDATVLSEISRSEALLDAAQSMLQEKVRMHELAKHVGRSQVEQSEAALKVAESNLARAEVDLKKTNLELERAKALSARQFIAAKELDDAVLAHERAQATVEMRRSEVEQLKADVRLAQFSKLNNFRDDAQLAAVRAKTAKSDIRKAEADLRSSRARLAELDAFKARLESQASAINQLKLKVATRKRQLESTEVTSPVNGVVVRRTANIGDIVQRGQALLKIIIEDTVEVRANVRETYLRYIRQGNPVDVYVDAYPDRVFTGKVKLIGDATDSEFALFKPGGPYTRIEQVIPVEISLDGNSNNRELKPGMNAWVYIKRNSALEPSDNVRQQARSPARP